MFDPYVWNLKSCKNKVVRKISDEIATKCLKSGKHHNISSPKGPIQPNYTKHLITCKNDIYTIELLTLTK